MKNSYMEFCFWWIAVAVVVWLPVYVAMQWPAAPDGTVFLVKPIEAHVRLAAQLLESGDTLRLAPDGVTRYWTQPLSIEISNRTNLMIHGGGTVFSSVASGVTSFCDVLLIATNRGFLEIYDHQAVLLQEFGK